MTDRTCKCCGAPFQAMVPWSTKKFCSDRCKSWAHLHPDGVEPPPPPILGRGCETCGAPMTGRHGNARFCDETCGRRFHTPLAAVGKPGPCDVCGKQSRGRDTPGPVSKFCSPRCEQWRRRNPCKAWVSRSCENCGIDIDHKKSHARFCTASCAGAAAGHRRRAAIRGLPSEAINKYEVFERDGWRCHLCHKKIRKALEWPHPMSASLDHIIPLACADTLGHVWRNVAASHLHCNLAKHVRPMNEQIKLIG